MSQIPRLNKYAKADVWPLNPDGEILCMIMCEDVLAIDNLPRILSEVRGIGVVLIGEGDLSQNLGFPPQYEHPAVAEAMTAIRRICAEHDMPCGHPHIDAKNAARHIGKGYRLLIAAPTGSCAGLDACRSLTGRTRADGSFQWMCPLLQAIPLCGQHVQGDPNPCDPSSGDGRSWPGAQNA